MLVMDIATAFETRHVNFSSEKEAWSKTYAKRTPAQLRKLHHKLAKARKALAALRTYAESIGGETNPGVGHGNVYLARGLENYFLPHVRKACDALDDSAWQTLRQAHTAADGDKRIPLLDSSLDPVVVKAGRQIYLPDPMEVEQEIQREPVPQRFGPKQDAIVRLFDFFVKCRLGKNEARACVGEIGNEFWGWNVAIDDEWTDSHIGARGCSAIRKRLDPLRHRDGTRKPR